MQTRAVRAAVLVQFFVLGVLIGSWASRIPDIKSATGLTEAGFGLLLLVMAVGAFFSFPVAGRLIDRLGSALVCRWSLALMLVSFAGIGLTVNTCFLIPFLFVTGFAIGGLDVAINAWGAELEKAMKRALMSSFHGFFSIGAAAGAGAGAVAIWADLSVDKHFILFSLVSMPALVFVIRTAWVAEDDEQPKAQAPIIAIPRGALLLAGLVALIAALGEGAVVDWVALFQSDELGYPVSLSAVGFAVFSTGMVIMRLAGDRIVSRHGEVEVARISGVTAFIGMMLVVSGVSIWVLWIGCALMGLGYAVLFPLAMSRAAKDPDMPKGAAIAAVATLGYGAFLFGPPVLGFIGSALSLQAALFLTGVLALAVPFIAGSLRVEK